MVLVALVVVGASAVVALGSTGARLILPPVQDEGWARVVRVAGVAAAIVGLVGLVVQRRRIGPAGRHGPDPTAAALLSAGALMGLVLLSALLMPRTDRQAEGGAVPPSQSRTINPDAPRTDPPPPPSSTAPVTEGFADGDAVEEPEWRVAQPEELEPQRGREGAVDRTPLRRVGYALLAVLLAAVVAGGILALRRRWAAPAVELPLEPPVDATEAEAGLEASLGEVTGEGDPRREITAAYGRLLVALADAGAGREPHEAPYEHLRRALEPLGVEPGAMHRLTQLYVLAQFGDRPVHEEHRADARDALERSLEALRARRPAPAALP